MIETLPRVVPAAPGKPIRAEAHAMQRASRALAQDRSVWSVATAREAVERYAELAPHWNDERGGYRPLPLADALARGGVPHAVRCVEIGCGTGLLTPLLSQVWSEVVCLDLTPEMLRRTAAPWRVLADAARVPLAGGRAGAVVLADVRNVSTILRRQVQRFVRCQANSVAGVTIRCFHSSRAHVAPRWSALLVTLFPAVDILVGFTPLDGVAGDVASSACGVVGFAALGFRLLATADADWDQTPAEPRPLAAQPLAA